MLSAHIDLYDWLKSVHVLLAVIWVGGAIALQVLAVKISRSNDAMRMAAFSGDVEWIGMRVFAPASGLLLVFGVWMVIDDPAWDFDQFWIIAAIAMFAYSFLSGLLYLGPQSGKLKTLFETEGPTSPKALSLMRRLFLVSRIELVLLVLIVFDMVLKPGL
ncbi:MAG: DUF2269 family protein [Actinomycetota bacterium]